MEKIKTGVILLLCVICMSKLDFSKTSEQFVTEINSPTENQSEIFGTLEIPALQLKKEIYQMSHPNNTVRVGIQLIKEDISQKKEDHFIVLAAHSGNGPHAYFNELEKLKIDDIISFYYQNQDLEYQYFQKELVDKTGVIDLNNLKFSFLVLITCSKEYSDKQEVYYAKLVKKSENLLQID